MRLLIRLAYQIGQTLYVVVRNAVTGQVWNPTTGPSGAWENYNSAHWAQYAIALTEQAGSGYYTAAYPAAIATSVVTDETPHQQAGGTPTLGDVPVAPPFQSQGPNVSAIGGDPTAAATLQGSLAAITPAAVIAGTLTAAAFTTNLTNANANAYVGMAAGFASGALRGQASTVTAYDPATGTLTVAAPFTGAPGIGDALVIY